MAAKAYILIEVETGKSEEVKRLILGIQGVTESDAVTGPYDVIAVVEVDNTGTLGSLILQQIQMIAGVKRTVTCVSIS
ncbi:MAG: putative transcriptional regulator, AsnC family [Dehalococcoidia bacterium]|nr:putative transcriptional regulator, AsnC family [Dehalococcoidia bacterium]